MSSDTASPPGWRTEITRTQWLVLAGTTLGWGLDGFAGSLYILVLGPAMGELLPNSGVEVGAASIGYYGGLTVALFLIGWATGGILFGVLADKFGRTRVLSVGILTYAVFSALAAFADTWWQLGLLRFVAGLGSGVEAPVGAALIAETWRNRFRARAGGIMMSGYAFDSSPPQRHTLCWAITAGGSCWRSRAYPPSWSGSSGATFPSPRRSRPTSRPAANASGSARWSTTTGSHFDGSSRLRCAAPCWCAPRSRRVH